MKLKVILFFLTLSFIHPWLFAQKTLSLEKILDNKKTDWGLTSNDLSDVILKDQYSSSHNGLQHYYYTQRYQGIEIFNAVLGIHLDTQGNLQYAASRFIPKIAERINATVPSLKVDQAVLAAAIHLQLDLKYELTTVQPNVIEKNTTIFHAPALSKSPIEARLVFQPLSDVVRLAWEILIEPIGKNDLWNLRIDALNGEVLQQDNWIVHCQFPVARYKSDLPLTLHAIDEIVPADPEPKTFSEGNQYRVFPLPVESPIHGSRTLAVNPANPAASPFGWHDVDGRPGPEYLITRGNNAHAYQDRTDKDRSQNDEPNGGENLIFDFPFNDRDSLKKNLPAAITQLFYTTNMAHDFAYHYGFDEAAGNFQETNYTLSGKGNDAVRAHAQNGAEINNPNLRNNANFSITPEGRAPVMQMYIWEPSGGNFLQVESPETIAGIYQTGTAEFGPPLTKAPLRGELVLAFDNSGSPGKVCGDVVNIDQVNGKIAMIDRGDCFFQQKILNVEAAGAIACVVCNYEDVPLQMAGSSSLPSPGIPSVILAYNDCQRIRKLLEDGVLINLQIPKEDSISVLDADFDNGIIIHEYTHGISSRLTGGPSTASCLNNNENLGEGWSDFFALVLTHPSQQNGQIVRGIGNYVIPLDINGRGIRRFPYSTDKNVNNQTYDDIIATNAVHEIGEIWAATLWDLYWAFIDTYGWDDDIFTGNGGNNIALQLVMDGMKLQVCNPGFVDARDAILEADRINNNGANECLIWKVFANRGLGWSSVQNNANNANDGIQAFDVLPTCIRELKIVKTVSPNVLPGDMIRVELTITNHKPEAVTDVIVSDFLGNTLRLASANITGANRYELQNDHIQFQLSSIPAGETRKISYSLSTDPSQFSRRFFLDNVEDRTNPKWTAKPITGNVGWKMNGDETKSGAHAWYVEGSATENDQVLELIDPILVQGEQPILRFFHSYYIEAGQDGGFVQISTDGGLRWESIPDNLFFRNPYRGNLSPATLAQPGIRAFWGATRDFIDSYVDLSGFIGQEIRLRFRYGSDQEPDGRALNKAGWWIDDIEVFDMFNYNTQACVRSAQGDLTCSLAPGRGTVVEPSETTTDIATLNTGSNGTLKLFPNPAQGQVNIALLQMPQGNAQLSVRAIDGRIIDQQQIIVDSDEMFWSLNTSAWSRGIYFVHLQTEQGLLVTKLVLQ